MNENSLLITGIHGLVGQYLFRILRNWKGKVVICGKGPCRLPQHDFVYEDMDIRDPIRINEVFNRHRPAVVIHAAAMAQPDQCELNRGEAMLVNVEATKFLLHAAEEAGSFFIYVSTDFVFSGNDGPYGENAVPAPVNFYGNTKLMAEELVKSYNHGWAIARTVLVYGNVLVGTRANIISWVKGELEQGKSIKVVGDQLRSPTYAADLAAGLLRIAEMKASGIWHLAGKDLLSPWDIAVKVANRLGLNSSLMTRVDASVFTQPATRPLRTPFLIDKARKALGYEPHSFDEGMEKLLNGD